ncbi:MAG: hypothetical protein MUP98_10805 [Candidatus Aminicenantes bacterium]|nr:hypothetical protein [Candidatus Aminicenantes bacterium]
MNKNIYLKTILFVLLVWTLQPVYAENVSFKFSFNTNNIQQGDLFLSTESFNTLWKDWKTSKGGSLLGMFDPITYGFNYEMELRIPIFAGFALNLGGSRLKRSGEGTIDFEQSGGIQSESHFFKNDITIYPFKIGFSYLFHLPFFSNLSVGIGGGRLIIFSKYESSERYDLDITGQEEEFNYWYERSNSYNSEGLGLYTSIMLEYELFKFMAIVLEAEQKWAKINGFKGPFSFTDFDGKDESGKASLYFYESNQWGLGNDYSILMGHEDRPDSEFIRNIRQGELNLNGYSFKVGIRFIF